jgi:hypothetical protein
MNTPMSVPPNGGGGLRQRLLRGTLLKWNEVDGYLDRDGVQPVEGPYLLWGMEQGYQRWKDQTVVEEIIDKPLPDLEQLNGAIPKSEWEPGLDGHPRPPYSHQYCLYLLDPNDGQFFTLMNSTVGMKMLWESIAERWEVMRHLRGADGIAVVNLATRPFRTAKWGVKYRPDLKIIEWRRPVSGGGDKLAGPVASTLQLPPQPSAPSIPPALSAPRAPSALSSTPAPAPVPMPSALTSPHPAPPPPRSANPTAPPPPPPARPAPSGGQKKTDGLAFLDEVKPPTLREELNDDLPFQVKGAGV